MSADEYQVAAHGFAAYGDESYPYLGLAEEAGEVVGRVAKFTRNNGGVTPWLARRGLTHALERMNREFRETMCGELGDVLWMVSEIATLNGLTLGEIMDANVAKLRDRAARGVIFGEGDDR